MSQPSIYGKKVINRKLFEEDVEIKKLTFAFIYLLLAAACAAETITPSPFWKNQIVFPDDPFCASTTSDDDPGWVKFTILVLDGYDPNLVYYQDCKEYVLHYDFATDLLDPFVGISASEYYQITLYEEGQQAILGAVIMSPYEDIGEYGIQFIRNDPYPREQIADMFNLVKASISADPNVQAFYFPTYEQLATAQNNYDWFESQDIRVSSAARWAEGNVCYSQGWALGELKFFGIDEIETAYKNGLLEPNDILLTDYVPAEIGFVSGIISLSPSVPSSHVAILANTFGVPFVHLALVEDANSAQLFVGHKVAFCAYNKYGACEVKLIDVNGVLTEQQIEEILALKELPPLEISPMAGYGAYSADTNGLLPSDIQYFGGKAANFGMLREAIPDYSPVAVAFSFDLWNEFLDQTLTPSDGVVIDPCGYLLFWADNDEDQGLMHTNFKLSAAGEDIGFYDTDGITLVDGITFGPQSGDVSYGRSPDGNDNWVFFSGGTATPGWSNTGSGGPGQGLFINEFMAENDSTIQDPNGSGYPDWVELYNAGPTAIELGGMYLTDDMNDPTKWMIPFDISGGTLREEIAGRLSGYTYPPADMATLSVDLSIIRNLIKNPNVTSFTQESQDAVIATLQDPNYGFDPNQKIRFRSSTNVEDSNQFTGAGLYDSYSGCLADDLDGDDDGPCNCDPNEPSERGVFRAIRKVFASFYNNNAFLERLRHDVNEAEVGMALLVHHSFPDEIELANGVATLRKVSGSHRNIMLVTQDGATSVANPEPGCIPEEVSVDVWSFGIYPTLVRPSNLVPLGDTVMEWDDDYIALSQLLVNVADKFAEAGFTLDFEYKKVAAGGAAIPAGGLVVKQVRQIPRPSTTPSITPFLINQPTQYCTIPNWGDGVFATHRLKSRWTLETKNFWLTPTNLEDSFYADARLEYTAEGRIRTLTGKPSLWPFAYHTFGGTATTDAWQMHHLQNPRTCELHADNIPTQVSPAQSPLVTVNDFWLGLSAEYAQPVASVDYGGDPITTTTDQIQLCSCSQPERGDLLQQRSFDGPNGVSITTSFYWPPWPKGIVIGYTAPLKRWVETVIEGYTTEPIVLHGYYSQTYNPEHHNFPEHFLFEPQLEPGISQDILDQLQAKNIRLIYMYYRYDPIYNIIRTYGFEPQMFIPGDFEPDGDVDCADFARLAQRWLDTVCDDCGGTDLNGDGKVNIDDLLELTENWLAGL